MNVHVYSVLFSTLKDQELTNEEEKNKFDIALLKTAVKPKTMETTIFFFVFKIFYYFKTLTQKFS